MRKRLCGPALLVIPLLIGGLGCGNMGKVDQGRVIAFDKAQGTVTFIRDASGKLGQPDYSVLPPATYQIPGKPEEMGQEPQAGLRMKLDIEARAVVIFDPASQGFRTIPYTLVEQRNNVAKEDPLVAGKSFPVVDQEKKTFTIYSGRQKTLVTFSLPDEYFALPPATWAAGDEVRVYYKAPGKALRLMNISKTDIFKK